MLSAFVNAFKTPDLRRKLLFVLAVIVAAILWITRTTIIHHFGVDLFPYLPRKK